MSLKWRLFLSLSASIAVVLLVAAPPPGPAPGSTSTARLEDRVVGVVAGAAVAGLALSLLTAAVVRRPAARLNDAAAALARGKWSARAGPLPPRTPRELRRLGQTFDTMAARVQSLVSDLAREKGRLAAILDNLADGIVVTGPNGRIILVNRQAERFFGTSRAAAQGGTPLEALRNHRVDDLFRRTAAEGRPQTARLEVGRPDRRELSAHVAPLPGNGRACCGVFHDLTNLARSELVRRDFVANVSHELRTPLSSVRALAETVGTCAARDPERAAGFAGRIVHEVERLSRLVDSLIDLTQLDAGVLPLQRRRVDMESLVCEVAGRFLPLAQAQRVELDVNVAGAAPPADTDPHHAETILGNLVDNAIKFTPAGGRVTITLAPEDQTVLVGVSDTGPGIPKSEVKRIFERFYRVERSRARQAGGFGLGLTIARHLAAALGGRLEVDSSEGRGSRFTLVLPRA